MRNTTHSQVRHYSFTIYNYETPKMVTTIGLPKWSQPLDSRNHQMVSELCRIGECDTYIYIYIYIYIYSECDTMNNVALGKFDTIYSPFRESCHHVGLFCRALLQNAPQPRALLQNAPQPRETIRNVTMNTMNSVAINSVALDTIKWLYDWCIISLGRLDYSSIIQGGHLTHPRAPYAQHDAFIHKCDTMYSVTINTIHKETIWRIHVHITYTTATQAW